jgi:hypothetical protein
MNTSTVPPEGLSVQAVATATGLDRASIYRAAELAGLGSPAHFRYRGTHIVYSLAGLCRLLDGLEELREDGAARLLRDLLRRARQEAAVAQGATRPGEPEVESWLSRFERRQEEAAA